MLALVEQLRGEITALRSRLDKVSHHVPPGWSDDDH